MSNRLERRDSLQRYFVLLFVSLCTCIFLIVVGHFIAMMHQRRGLLLKLETT